MGHSGSKYIREIESVGLYADSIPVDVYCVLEAFDVRCPGLQHAIKKLLCAGIRGKADCETDLQEAIDAIKRSIILNKQRQRKQGEKK